jgi:hypothetical protein
MAAMVLTHFSFLGYQPCQMAAVVLTHFSFLGYRPPALSNGLLAF